MHGERTGPRRGPTRGVRDQWSSRIAPLLTESEVQRSFRRLFKENQRNEETFQKAEALLDELRGESPLRHRLAEELEELRKLAEA